MERIPHHAAIYGDWAAAGALFHPVPDRVADVLGSVLLPADADVPESYRAVLAELTRGVFVLNLALPITVWLYMSDADGARLPVTRVVGPVIGMPIVTPDARERCSYTMVEMVTGAYVIGFTARSGELVEIGADDLAPVDDPGIPERDGSRPVPTDTAPIPPDSPPVLVAAGDLGRTDPNGAALVAFRTQHWQKAADSYSLPAHSALAVTLTQTSGITSSSSSLDAVAGSVGMSASVGWGPVSASITASMSRSTTTSQEVTVTSETETTVVREFVNEYDVGCVVFLWQLVDRLVITARGAPGILAMVETLVLPTVPASYAATGGPFPGPAVARSRR